MLTQYAALNSLLSLLPFILWLAHRSPVPLNLCLACKARDINQGLATESFSTGSGRGSELHGAVTRMETKQPQAILWNNTISFL